MARVAVVMPVFNQRRYIVESVLSVLAQTYRDFRLVVVDDGSSDGSIDELSHLKGQITLIEGPHRGPAAARNAAIRSTRSELVAFLDGDDIAHPLRLARQVAVLDRQGGGMVSSAMKLIDSDGNPLPAEWTRPAGAERDHWGSLLERNWIVSSSVLLTRQAVERAGLFDEEFSNAEDYDLWLRVGGLFPIGYIDEPLVSYRRHSANTSNNIAAHQSFESRALRKVDAAAAEGAFARLYPAAARAREEANIWFLLRRAEPSFERHVLAAISQFPQSRELRFAYGVFLTGEQRHHDALSVFTALNTGEDAAVLNNLAVLYTRCGAPGEARPLLSSAVALRPDYGDARQNLAACESGLALRLTPRPLRPQLVPVCAV